MKILTCTGLLIAAFCTEACANNPSTATAHRVPVKETVAAPAARPDSFAIGKVIDTVVCAADADQSYAAYIPATGNKKALPVIYFFDPHASGSLPLHKYKALADKYGFLLIGSNNSKNGNDWQTADAIWQILSDDTRKRFHIDLQRIYTAGFSGGAKVASFAALNHPEVKGVIANGAGLPDGAAAGNYAFSFTAITGEGDMNMTELVAISKEFDQTNTRHRLMLFNGKHEWAPEKTMDVAFAGFQFDAMRNKLLPVNTAFINSYVTNGKKIVDAYTKENNLLKAVAECVLSGNLLSGLSADANWFSAKATALSGQAAYKKQEQEQQQILATEQNIKARYAQQFNQGDMEYWKKEIADLQTKAKATTVEGAMYQRLLAYLSLAFYSFSNQLVGNHRDVGAEYYVNLYKMVDPTNSEAWYFSAILHARLNDLPAVEADLLKAVACGFNDKARMHSQNDFVDRGIDFSKIEKGMK
jgi:pimeloyl-ACP methyl ester carboxylesterase